MSLSIFLVHDPVKPRLQGIIGVDREVRRNDGQPRTVIDVGLQEFADGPARVIVPYTGGRSIFRNSLFAEKVSLHRHKQTTPRNLG